MDIREVRLERLLDLLAEEKGKRAVLAARLKKSPSQLSQWLGRHRTITEDSAREIERNAKKPALWMDVRSRPVQAPINHPPSAAQPDLAEQLVDLVASLPAARWRSVRAQLDSLVGEPAMRDDVLGELRHLLEATAPAESSAAPKASPGKPRQAA